MQNQNIHMQYLSIRMKPVAFILFLYEIHSPIMTIIYEIISNELINIQKYILIYMGKEKPVNYYKD